MIVRATTVLGSQRIQTVQRSDPKATIVRERRSIVGLRLNALRIRRSWKTTIVGSEVPGLPHLPLSTQRKMVEGCWREGVNSGFRGVSQRGRHSAGWGSLSKARMSPPSSLCPSLPEPKEYCASGRTVKGCNSP